MPSKEDASSAKEISSGTAAHHHLIGFSLEERKYSNEGQRCLQAIRFAPNTARLGTALVEPKETSAGHRVVILNMQM